MNSTAAVPQFGRGPKGWLIALRQHGQFRFLIQAEYSLPAVVVTLASGGVYFDDGVVFPALAKRMQRLAVRDPEMGRRFKRWGCAILRELPSQPEVLALPAPEPLPPKSEVIAEQIYAKLTRRSGVDPHHYGRGRRAWLIRIHCDEVPDYVIKAPTLHALSSYMGGESVVRCGYGFLSALYRHDWFVACRVQGCDYEILHELQTRPGVLGVAAGTCIECGGPLVGVYNRETRELMFTECSECGEEYC